MRKQIDLRKKLQDSPKVNLTRVSEQKGSAGSLKFDSKNNILSKEVNKALPDKDEDTDNYIETINNTESTLKSSNKPNKGLNFLNFMFTLLAIVLLTGNIYFVFNFTVENKTPVQAVTTLAKNSLELVDTVWEPKLQTSSEYGFNYTGVLLMGIDSRQLQFDGEEFKGKDRDIDSIIQVVFNHDTGKIFTLSIPRDTGVTVKEACVGQSKQYFRSINHIYKMAEDGGCEGGGVRLMQEYVTYVTGFKNHYYAIISYDGFRQIINTLGDDLNGKKGLYIDVPKSFTDYYPRESGGGFERVTFKQGNQFIDSVALLKYARVRKSSTDFERARRQQQVIEALQKKVLSDQTLFDPVKVFELYQTFQKNALFSPISLDDIRAGLKLYQNGKFDADNINKIIIDDNFGGRNSLLTKPAFSGGLHNRPGYYLSPMDWNSQECIQLKDEYCKVKEKLRQVVATNNYTEEEALVYAYSNVAGKSISDIKQFSDGRTRYIGDINISSRALAGREGWGDIQIYDFTGGKKPQTLAALESAFGAKSYPSSTAAFTSAPNKEDFVIVVKTNQN